MSSITHFCSTYILIHILAKRHIIVYLEYWIQVAIKKLKITASFQMAEFDLQYNCPWHICQRTGLINNISNVGSLFVYIVQDQLSNMLHDISMVLFSLQKVRSKCSSAPWRGLASPILSAWNIQDQTNHDYKCSSQCSGPKAEPFHETDRPGKQTQGKDTAKIRNKFLSSPKSIWKSTAQLGADRDHQTQTSQSSWCPQIISILDFVKYLITYGKWPGVFPKEGESVRAQEPVQSVWWLALRS